MKKLLIDLVWRHLHSLGAFGRREQTLSAARIAGGLLPVYDAWFRECIRIFEQEGYLERQEDRIVVGAAPAQRFDELWQRWGAEKVGWLQNRDLVGCHALLEATLRALPDILTGKKAATEVIFPNSSLTLVENTYKNNPMSDFFNRVLATKVAAHVQQRISQEPGLELRILEIGAGTGATSAVVLGAIKDRRLPVKEYCYTDVSKAFLNHAEQSYGPTNPFLKYRILNIEIPIAEQGVDVAGYDVVIAANVLHATRSIRKTLRNTKALLKKNGLLFLNEMTANNLFNHLTFGLLEGWWLYEDPELRLPGSPGLSVETWRHVLEGERYGSVTFPCLDASDLGGQVIVAESDGIVRLPEKERRLTPERAAMRAGPGGETGRQGTRAMNGGVPRSTARDRIERSIVEELARSLRIDRSRIRLNEPFSTYGLDSILAVQLTRSINEELGIDLDITVMFEHNTVDALRDHVASAFKSAIAPGSADVNGGSSASTTHERVSRSNGAEDMVRERQPDTGVSVPEDTLTHVESVVIAVLSESLRIERSRIGRREPFSSYGLDSILAVNVTRVINEKLSIDLDITVLFEHGTTAQLCEFIVANHGAQLRAELPAKPASAKPMAGDISSEASSVMARESARPGEAHPKTNERAEGFAIVGMSGRFPKADDIDAFWQVLEKGQSCITTPPVQRDDWKAYADGSLGKEVNIAKRWGGFMDGIHEFDPLFFGISMTEAKQMTPEQRLMLMCAWNAVEDAGYTPKELANHSTGVFIAAGPSEYQPAQDHPGAPGGPSVLSTPLVSMVPNRISYFLNLHGPSEYCETTCSSSIVALHRAIQSVGRGECAQAIVGAVNLILSPAGFVSMESVGMLSPSGKARPFQDNAEGTVRSEGVGAILIKPLKRAIEDGDFIYAIVKGTGVAHGGKGVSFTAPNIRGMKAAILQAYGEAGVDPSTVSYIEAHGMSSTLADSAEMAALSSSMETLSRSRPDNVRSADATIYLGSLKPCIGHAEVFSGMAALMKTVLAIRHKIIPSIPGFGRLNDSISLEGSRLRVATENTPWPALVGDDGDVLPRRASINSFGIGGVNAHAVLEEYSPAGPHDGLTSSLSAPQVIVLSAKDEERLRARARLLVVWMKDARTLDLADVAYTLQLGREAMDCRLAVVAETREEVIDGLEALLANEPRSGHRVAFATGEQRNSEIVELFSTNASDALLRSLVAEHKMDVIAKYWVKGAPIDWSLLHQRAKRRRVPLPGYPFKRLNCWGQSNGQRAPRVVSRPQAISRGDVAVGPEEFVTSLVASVLGLGKKEIDRARPLDLYGLNSLLLVTMLNHMRSAFPGFQPSWLQAHDTLDGIVARLSSVAGDVASSSAATHSLQFPELVHLNATTQGRPVFWIHGALGSVETFQSIASRSKRPFYAIQARGFVTKHSPIEGIEAMASHYIDIIRTVQPKGPYDVGGFCLGGIISYEMTRQLQLQGQAVSSMVMVDSPDNTGFTRTIARVDFSSKNAALQVANALLWPANEKDLARVARRLIHQNEIDSSLSSDELIERLAGLAVERGLSMAPEAVVEFIERNLKVQLAYKLGEYVIRPLAEAAAVDCTYFRNSRGLFFGELGCYFNVAGEPFSLDHVNYWQDWQRELKKLRIVDIEAANHMTILYEDQPLCAIGEICEELYSR